MINRSVIAIPLVVGIFISAPLKSTCNPNATIDDPTGDTGSKVVDIHLVELELHGESLTATLHLDEIPSEMVFDRTGVLENLGEYVWEVSIDVDADPETGHDGDDYMLSAMHFVFTPDQNRLLPLELGVQSNVWKLKETGFSVYGDADIIVNQNMLTLSGIIPGINKNSKARISAYDDNPEGSPQVDYTDQCSVGGGGDESFCWECLPSRGGWRAILNRQPK